MKNRPLASIAAFLDIACDTNTQVTGYQVDSRLIAPGNLFFALPGEKTDGHHFLSDVRARGGAAAVVSTRYAGPSEGLVLLRAADVLQALQALAQAEAAQTKARIIGVTGSMGKTTTKDFIATLLEGKFRVGKTHASYNTQLTLPITILNMCANEEVWVLEMGMGKPGDLLRLVQIAPPEIAVMTQVAMAHYGDYFAGVSDVAVAKAEIFSEPATKLAIVSRSFLQYPNATSLIRCPLITYAPDDPCPFSLPFSQPHVVHNCMGAIAAARAIGMECDEIARQIPKLRLPQMRFETFEKGGILFINDAYNANPESVKGALACLPEPRAGGKRIAVLGHMTSLGPVSQRAHEEVGAFARARVDHLLTFAEEAFGPAEHFVEIDALVARLCELMLPGDVVLVKGSRFLQMERIFTKLCFSS